MQKMTNEEPKTILDYWKTVKRRRYQFCIPVIGISLVALFYAISIPSVYRSEATILIEDQEIPEDIVGATISNYASQQIQLISQRILTVSNIHSIIEKFNVYESSADEKEIPLGDLAELFRADVGLDLVSAEVFDARGRSTEAAVAFTLAFHSEDPEVAQKVSQELVALFLNENRRSGESRSIGVSTLLKTSIREANRQLLIAESELAEFKGNNEGALPELYQLNFDVISRTEQQLSDVNLRIQELQQRILQLSAQLTSIAPSAPVTLPSGETIMSDRERLRTSLIEYRRKSSIYEPGHPDLIRLKREIDGLQETVGKIGTDELLREQLRQERQRLSDLRERYSANHPDVRDAESAVASLESQVGESGTVLDTSQLDVANNPAFVLINTQLQSAHLEIQSLITKRDELRAVITKHEALIRQAPHVEMQYEALRRSYENAGTKYRDLQAKLRAAEVAADVEQEISGQRFTLIEPPALPINPEEQNRGAIMMLGILFAVGAGAGIVVLAEGLDDSIRSAKDLASVVGTLPLAVIPYLDNSVDIANAKTRRVYLIGAFFAGTAFTIAYILYLL